MLVYSPLAFARRVFAPRGPCALEPLSHSAPGDPLPYDRGVSDHWTPSPPTITRASTRTWTHALDTAGHPVAIHRGRFVKRLRSRVARGAPQLAQTARQRVGRYLLVGLEPPGPLETMCSWGWHGRKLATPRGILCSSDPFVLRGRAPLHLGQPWQVHVWVYAERVLPTDGGDSCATHDVP